MKKVLIVTVVSALVVSIAIVFRLNRGMRTNPIGSTGTSPELIPEGSCIGKNGFELSYAEAVSIAQSAQCNIGEGKTLTFTDNYFCNEVTGTVWIDVKTDPAQEGCNPACVVTLKDKTAEINWRCTGVIVP